MRIGEIFMEIWTKTDHGNASTEQYSRIDHVSFPWAEPLYIIIITQFQEAIFLKQLRLLIFSIDERSYLKSLSRSLCKEQYGEFALLDDIILTSIEKTKFLRGNPALKKCISVTTVPESMLSFHQNDSGDCFVIRINCFPGEK